MVSRSRLRSPNGAFAAMRWTTVKTETLQTWRPRVGDQAALLRWRVSACGLLIAYSAFLACPLILIGGVVGDVFVFRATGVGLFLISVVIGCFYVPRLVKKARRAALVNLSFDPNSPLLRTVELPPSSPDRYDAWLSDLRKRLCSEGPGKSASRAKATPAVPTPSVARVTPRWARPFLRFALLTNSCFRCLARPHPHAGCGAKDCDCAQRGHPGVLGPM